MNQPNHDAVAQRARELWQKYGSPAGRDTEIWLEAEHELTGQAGAKPESTQAFSERVKSETAAESVVENHLSPAPSDTDAIKAAVQAKAAREPISPHHTAPKGKAPAASKPPRKQPR